jgi:hypothetical protein
MPVSRSGTFHSVVTWFSATLPDWSGMSAEDQAIGRCYVAMGSRGASAAEAPIPGAQA